MLFFKCLFFFPPGTLTGLDQTNARGFQGHGNPTAPTASLLPPVPAGARLVHQAWAIGSPILASVRVRPLGRRVRPAEAWVDEVSYQMSTRQVLFVFLLFVSFFLFWKTCELINLE